MAELVIARALGPLETIVNVNWGAGAFVQVMADSDYVHGNPGSRRASLALSNDAQKAGAKILGEKTFQTNDRMNFNGVMRFPRLPKNVTEAFRLILSGATGYTDEQYPQPSLDEFCGTSTSSSSYERFLVHWGDGQVNVWETHHFSYSSPAGSASGSSSYELQAVTVEDVNNPPPSTGATSQNIWYRDTFGNYINTYKPCSELAEPGDPPTPASHTEGFKTVDVSIFPQTQYTVLPLNEWTNPNEDKVQPAGDETKAFGGPVWRCIIGPYKIGLNSDFNPIYEDLPDGSYEFRMGRFTFLDLPRQKPDVPFTTIGAYPMKPPVAGYDFGVGTTKPYRMRMKLPASPEVIAAGIAPSPTQAFEP
jgi:hypothetical protein